jgi:uncharacterized protein YgfB (UPF0149 family)
MDETKSSICSTMSNVTVSAFGEDVLLEDAVDDIFKQIQTHINELHIQIRQLCMTEDRNDSYEEAYEYYYEIIEHVKEANVIFKELPKVCKQILPPRPKELPKTFEKEFKPNL